MRTTTEKIIEAYFQGGNAKDKSHHQIKDTMKVIIEVMEEEEENELKPAQASPPKLDPYPN